MAADRWRARRAAPEARLVKERKPTENRLLRETDAVFGCVFDPPASAARCWCASSLGGGDPADWADVMAASAPKKRPTTPLRELATLYKLCPRRIGTEPWGDGACLAHQMKGCAAFALAVRPTPSTTSAC